MKRTTLGRETIVESHNIGVAAARDRETAEEKEARIASQRNRTRLTRENKTGEEMAARRLHP